MSKQNYPPVGSLVVRRHGAPSAKKPVGVVTGYQGDFADVNWPQGGHVSRSSVRISALVPVKQLSGKHIES